MRFAQYFPLPGVCTLRGRGVWRSWSLPYLQGPTCNWCDTCLLTERGERKGEGQRKPASPAFLAAQWSPEVSGF